MADQLLNNQANQTDSALAPAERGQAGSPISLTANDVPELSDLAVGDEITFKVVNVTQDGVFELAASTPMSNQDSNLEGALGISGQSSPAPAGDNSSAPDIQSAL